jgi:hypothetical protein
MICSATEFRPLKTAGCAALSVQTKSRLHEPQTTFLKVNNFKKRLPEPQSDIALAVLKATYVSDFLSVGGKAHERERPMSLLRVRS